MISYDNYKNRIEKLAKFKRTLHKFRFLICGVLALIVGASVGLMVAKGSYTSGMSLSAQTVMFNEDYEVTAAKAFLASASEQHIEYRGEEGDWTREKPVKAGRYSARTVTKKIVGYNYSPEVSFEIKPLAAEFIITADSVTYGDIPKYSLPQLVAGHRVDESVLEFEYAEYGAAKTEVKVNADTLKIIDKNGEDFSDCYRLAEPQGKELTIGKRKITVTPVSYDFIYDAQPHYTGGDVSEDTEERLVAGDTLSVTTAISTSGTAVNGAVNAGRYTVNIESASIYHDGKDISNWYDIINRTSGLTVTARPLTVTTGDAQKVYDGTPAVNTEFTYDNLIDGHTISVNTSTLITNSNVGQHKNLFGVVILDGSTDVTNNYKVTCNAGTLTITPATLAVTTATPETHTYDGYNFTDFTFAVADSDKLGSDFVFAAVESLETDTKDAGEYVNKFDVAVFLNGREVTENFEISYVYGKLTVTKRALTVTTVGGSKVYDGEKFTYTDVYGDNLADKQTLKEVTPFSVTNVTAASGVEIAAKFTVIDQSQRDVGKNYEISYSHGSLIIEPLKISVKTVDASREYDGTAFTAAGYEVTRLNAEGTGLIGEDVLFPTGISTRTEAGSQPNVCNYRLPYYDEVHTNYELVGEITYGTLTVEPKKVTVTLNDAEAVYGESIPQNGFILSCGELPNNEELTFTTHYELNGETRTPETWETYTLLNAGTYLIEPNGDKQITGGYASVDNYEFTFVAGILEITQRVIYYVTADDTKIYDGTELYNTGYETCLLSDSTKAGLLNNDELSVLANPTSIVQVQKRPNANYYTAPNNNYYIDTSATVFGWLEVTPRPIIVYTGSDSKPYDGTPLTHTEDYTAKYAVEIDGVWVADDSEVGLIAGDELTLKGAAASITNFGETANANRYENGNYSIKAYVDGTLKIEKYKVNIQLRKDYTAFYGKMAAHTETGLDFFLQDGEKVSGTDVLVNGERLSVRIKYKQNGKYVEYKNVGTYTVVPEWYAVFGADNELIEDGDKNYEIECSEGELTITPCKVEVTINDGTAVYGDDVSANEYGFVTDPAELPYNEQLTLTYKYDREVKDVGEYDILENKFYIDGAEEGVNNYDFTFNKGTLTVKRKAIYTYIKAKSCVYGDDLPEIEWWISYGDNLNTENVPVTEFPYGDTVELEGFLYYKLENREPCGWHSAKPRLNAGKYIVGYNSWDIRNTDGDRCEDNYYVFSGFNDGLLTVTPAPLKITLADITGVYGDEITYPAEQTIVEGLKYNQTLSFEVKYADEEGNFVVPKNAGEYGIFPDEDTYAITEEDGTEGLISNYTVTIENSTLTIGKKQVHIKIKDRSAKYGYIGRYAFYVPKDSNGVDFERVDGSDEPILAYDEVFIAVLGYKDGSTVLNETNDSWRLSVGDYSMYVEKYIISVPDTAVEIINGIANYDIECEEGTLTVEPYTVTVKPNDRTCVYGTPEDEIEDKGYEYTDSQTIVSGGLPYGENLILSYSYDPSPVTDVGTYAIKATATGVEDGDLENYEVSYEDGTLTVEALEIYVVLNDTNKTEYGTAPKDTGYKVYLDAEKTKKYTLSDGDEFKADYEYYKFDDADKTTVTVRNVGYYGIRAVNGRIETSDGETSDNYVVNVIDGKLTVDKKTVTVELNQIDPVYYGETFTYAAGADNFANFETIELAYNERLEVAVEYLIDGVVGIPKNANYKGNNERFAYSARLNASACKVYESDGETVIEDGADNYDFICEDVADLKIAIRPIKFTTFKFENVQYGNEVKYPDEIGNYKKAMTHSSEGWEEKIPYDEQFKIEVRYSNSNGYYSVHSPKKLGWYKINIDNLIVYDKYGNEIENGSNNYVYITDSDSTLEIVPREITIRLNSYEMQYGEFYIENEGGTFQYPETKNNYDVDNSDPLVYGQTLEIGYLHCAKYQKVEGGEFVTPKDVGTYIITFEEGDYIVYDGEETYYDGSYDITFVTGTLTITKKKIAVKLDDISCKYGEELPEHTYKIYESLDSDTEYTLPYGDKFAITGYWYTENRVLVTPKNAGSYGIGVSTHTFTDVDGKDVSANYSYNYYGGTLTINKADLEITLPDITGMKYGDEWTYPYDGIQISGLKYSEALEVAVKFVDGDGNFVEEPKNAGTYTVVLDEDNCKITNEDGTDGLLSNYEIDCVDGVINIDKRALEVNFKEDYFTIEYGDPLPELEPVVSEYGSDEEYTLPYNEEITFGYRYLNLDTNEYETPKRAGYVYEVQINRVYIDGVSQTNESCNYVISYGSHGEPWIEIREKIVKPTIKDFTKAYGETISYEFVGKEKYDENGNEFLGYGESVKFIVRYLQDGKEVTPVNKGVYDIEIVDYIVYDEDGVEITNGADNYDFRPDCGKMTIAALEVTITVDDLTATYGEDISELENGFTVDTEMPFGEELELAYSCSIENPDVGEHKNAVTATVVGVNGGNGSLGNYDIKEVVAGKLTVVAREITVTVAGATAVYGYTQLPEIAFEVTEGEMVGAEELVPVFVFSLNGTVCEPINAGTYDISVDEDNTTVEGGNASYGNYAVTYVCEGQLVINRAPLTVAITGNSFVYGDNGLNVTFDITEGELFHGDELELTYEYINKESGDKTDDPTAAGTYAITATAEIVGGNESADNYEITYEDDPEPTLTILKRGIEIKLNKGEVNAFTYGDDYGAEICKAEITDAVSGHTITVAVTYAKKEESGTRAARASRARAFSARNAEAFIPKDAGTYIASLDFANCTVTDADGNPVEGGIDNYELSTACDAVEFEILPMVLTVTVNNAEITYGDKLPTALEYTVTQEMPYGESLALTFSLADEDGNLPVHKGDYAVSITGVSVNGGSLGNYKPEYTNENPTLTIKAKSVTVTLKNLSVSYGAEVKYEVKVGNYVNADGLLSGDELTVTKVYYRGADDKVYDAENPPVNVGTYEIVYDGCAIVNADGEDASDDYAVTGEDGVLVIDSSLITVYTSSAEKEYDGTALFTEDYDDYDGELGDYRLVADKDNICKQIDATDGDGVDNTTVFKIVDADGNETDNLQVQYGTSGKLKVTRRSAQITISDTTAVYGEKPAIGHTAVGLVDGEDVEFEVEYDEVPVIDGDRFILPVGGYLMNYKEGTATIVGGRGLASNYDLTFDYDAFLEVTVRHIAIATADGSTEYNGKAFSKADGYTTEWVVDGVRQGAAGLLGEDTLTPADVASLIEEGTCENACTYTASINYYIDEDMYGYGTLTVTKRTITAKTADVDETYDGEAHFDGTVTDVDNKLAEGHEFRVTGALVTRTDVCENVDNVLTVTIVDTNDGDKDVTANYTLNYDYGRITISPRLLKITTGGATVAEYDGTPYGNTDYAEADGLLTDFGHGLVVDTAFTYTNATVGVDNKTTYKVYCGGVDISGNYDIQYTYGKIVIGKKAVTVTLNGGVQVEYGDGSYKKLLTENAVELVNGETAEIAIVTDRTVGGKSTYTATADWANTVIKNADGKVIKDGKDNYAVTTSSVDFEVIPRTVTVTLNKDGKTEFAYGEDYKSAIGTVIADSMVDGEEIVVAVTYSEPDPKDVGEYTAVLDIENCTVVGGDTENYIFVDGGAVTFNIVAKVLTVYMNDLTVAFNEPLEYPAGDAGYYRVEGLEYGETLTSVKPAFEKNGVRLTPTYAGEYDVVCGTVKVNGGEVDSKNYSIKTGKPYGKLTIEGINVSVERLDVEKIYDGAPLELPNVATENEINYFVDDGGSNELPAGYTIELAAPFATKDGNVSSSCANEAKYVVLDENGEIARNYVITYVENDAKLTIKPLPFTVEIADITKVYGEDLDVNKYKQATLLNSDKLLYRVQIFTEEGELCDTGKRLDAGTYVIDGNASKMTFGSATAALNYSISFAPATLTINKRGIIVTTPTASAEYSGSPFSATEGYATQWIKDGVKQNASGLLGTDELTPVGTPASQTEVGSCRNECEYTANENYEIVSYVYGKLTVTKKVINVTTGGIKEVYCGTAYTNGEFSCDTELPERYTMERTGALLEFTDVTEDGVNEFDVIIKNAGGDDVTGNYKINYTYGTVEISPAELEITLGETEDGENVFNYGDGTFEGIFKRVTAEGLVTGDDLSEIVLRYSTGDGKAPVNAGTYTVWFDDENSVIPHNGKGNRVGNYKVICEPVEFTIRRASVTLTLGSWASEEYDGKEHVYSTDGCELVTDLFGDENLENIVVKYSTEDGKALEGAPVNAGTYNVYLDTNRTTVKADGAEIAIGTNYEVTCEPLEFEITPKTLTITFGNVTHTYDGTEFDFAASEGFKTNLCKGDEIKRSYKYDAESVKNVGTYTVTFDGDTVEFTSGLASNYEFDNSSLASLEATLTVTEREITVTVADRDVERGEYEGYAEYTKADLDGDFAEGDLDKAEIVFVYTDKDGNDSYDAPENAGTYTVKVELGGSVMNNYAVETVEGTLIITERKVLVTPVFTGDDNTYNGSAMAFWYSDVRNVEGAAGEKGFLEDDANVDNFEVKFTYTDEKGEKHEGTPVKAGTYKVEVELSGDGIGQYSVTCEPITFTVKMRPLSYSVTVDGEKSFVYNKLRPELDTTITATGFADGEGDDCDFELYIGNKVATRYDVGTYEVRITFKGIENYDITATTDEIKITPRMIVVTPVDRYNGVPQVYDGNNLKLREDRDFNINSKELENGGLAAGDTLTIQSTEIAPTAPSGDLKIVNVFINDAEGDVLKNYTVISSYNRNNALVKQLGLQLGDFQKRASYVKTEIEYTLGDVGGSYSYTGATRVHGFDDTAISLGSGTLFEGHRLAFSKNSVNVPAAADRYEDLITKLVCVVDGEGNRLAIYSLSCANPENGVITVSKTVVSVDLSGLSVSDLTVGELNRTVTFEGDNPAVCGYEVRAFMLDGKWLIGVMLFNETSGRRVDLSANYELNEACTLDGAEVRIITLTEAAEFGLPEIKVIIAADDISGLYTYDNESRWVLNGGYTVTNEALLTANGHNLQVLVFREREGYLLGVTVYSEDGNGLRTEAGGNYRVIVESEINARYVTMSEISTLKRELHLDFGSAINEEDGTLNTGLVTVSGLNNSDNHEIEMTLEDNGDGTYTVKVNVYQLRRMGSSYLKVNMTERYELHWVAPDCVKDVVLA